MTLVSWRQFPLVLALVLTGCASAPKPSDYLDDYERLEAGRHLERVWTSAAFDSGLAARMQLGSIEPRRVVDFEEVTVEQAVGWLRDGLRTAGFPFGDNGRYRLDLVISEMNPGSAAARIWAGEFGAGHAFAQVEGRVTDTATDEVVATFAERRRASGAAGLRDLGGDTGPAMVEELIKAIGADIAAEFAGPASG